MKNLVPAPIRSPLGKLPAVFRRLRIWRKVNLSLAGVTPGDSKVLRRAVLRSPITVWNDLDQWQFPMVDSDCVVTANGIGKFQVRGYTDDLFHVLPMQEPAVETTIRSLLRPGDVFIDAGSNIGFYTILAANLLGASGRVIACEMVPETANILRQHVSLNKCNNVTVAEGALGPVAGQAVKASVEKGKSGRSSITRDSDGPTVEVHTMTLADLLRAVQCVKLMKMDLEGAELGALRGLGTDIDKIKAIIFENQNDPETPEFLREHGFTVKRIDGRNALAELKD